MSPRKRYGYTSRRDDDAPLIGRDEARISRPVRHEQRTVQRIPGAHNVDRIEAGAIVDDTTVSGSDSSDVADGAGRAVTGLRSDGMALNDGVGIDEGSGTQVIFRHAELVSVTADDADASGVAPVTFASSFVNAPAVVLAGFSGLTYDATEDGNDQKLTVGAQDITTSGFNAIAQIKSGVTVTAQTDDFDSGNSLTALNDTEAVALSAAGTYNDSYTIRFDISVTAYDLVQGGSESVTVAIDSSDDGGSNWTERWTNTYSATTTHGAGNQTNDFNNVSVNLSVSGLGNGDEFRLRIKSVSSTGDAGEFTAHGHNVATDGDSGYGASYSTTSGGNTYSAIRDDGDGVSFLAVEKS